MEIEYHEVFCYPLYTIMEQTNTCKHVREKTHFVISARYFDKWKGRGTKLR